MTTGASIGGVNAKFTADTQSFDASVTGVGKQLQAAGDQAVKAAEKVEQAGQQIDRTAQMQERAVERARRAWQRELQAQDQRIAKEREVSRAKELAALRDDILARSEKSLGDAMQHTVPGTAASSAALRVLEGNVTNNIRAAERFIGTVPGMSAVLQAAFPVVGAIAFAGVAVELGEKLYKAFDLGGERARLLQTQIRDVTNETTLDTVAINVQIDKLQQEQAKLEHKPFNGIKMVLDEAAEAALELSKKLDQLGKQEQTVIEGMAASIPQQVFGKVGTGYEKTMLEEHLKWVDQAKTEQDKLNESVSFGNSLQVRLNELKGWQANLDKAAETSGGETGIVRDYKNEINAVQELIAAQQREHALISASIDLGKETKKTQFDRDQHGATGLENQAETKRMEEYRNELERTNDGILDDETRFWQKKLALEKVGSKNYELIQAEIAKIARKYFVEGEKRDAEYLKIQQDIFADADKPATDSDEFKSSNRQYTETLMGRLKAMGEVAQINRDLATLQEQLAVKSDMASGAISRQTGEIELQAIAVAKLTESLQLMTEKRDALALHPELETASYNVPLLNNQISQMQGQLMAAQADLDEKRQLDTLRGTMSQMFHEWIQRANDLKDQVRQLGEQSLTSVNDTISKMLTGQYKRGDWTRTGQQVFSGISKTALQDGEGFLMKGLGLGKMGKMGTQGNPMWVKSVDAGMGAGSAMSGIFGQGSTSTPGSSVSQGVSGLLSAVLPFAGFLADGGSFPPGTYMVGERGPELMNIGSSGYMHSNADLREAVSGSGSGGGGDTHHHWNIDARGAHDPVAVNRAVQRGIASAAPHIAASAIAANRDIQRRRPSTAGG